MKQKWIEEAWQELEDEVSYYDTMKAKLAYWFDEKTGGYVELAGSKWDGDLTDEELLAKAQKIAEQVGMNLNYGKIVIETVEGEE